MGACRFCGRGLCENHVRSMPFVISLVGHEPVRALVVEDALYCGTCRPRPDPVELPELNEP